MGRPPKAKKRPKKGFQWGGKGPFGRLSPLRHDLGGYSWARQGESMTLRELQSTLPYPHDFRANPSSHKDFGRALLHVQKACGKLAAVVNDAEHAGSDFQPEEVDRYIADLVVCALRMANTSPHISAWRRQSSKLPVMMLCC